MRFSFIIDPNIVTFSYLVTINHNIGMKRFFRLSILVALALACSARSDAAARKVTGLRCEYSVDPECIDATAPRLSWTMESSRRGESQSAWQVLVATSRKNLKEGKADVWDSGKVTDDRSSCIEYAGKALASGNDYFWKVRIWNADGRATRWSKPAKWSMGLLDKAGWCGAEWIAFKDRETWKAAWDAQKAAEAQAATEMIPGESWPWANWKDSSIFTISEKTNYDPSPLFRKEFRTKGKVARADLYICGLGYYIPYLNGKRVGDKELNPAWSNFDQRSFYDRYDVTSLIGKENAIGVMLGRGQYNPLCNDIWGLCRSSWVDEPKLIALLRIEYRDGTVEAVTTDSSWKVTGGPVVYDDTRHGELYDARLEKEGWDSPGYDDSTWDNASGISMDARLVAQTMPPVRRHEALKPVRTFDSYQGSKVYDIGKQIPGWAKVKVKGPRDAKVLVEYCERPSNKEICPDLAPSCYEYSKPDPLYASFYDKCTNVRQQNGYIMKGDPAGETFECHFSYKGFRYIRVWSDSEVEILGVEGIPVHTDFETTGSFECSDPVVNTLQQNAINSMYSNFVSIPTDCPHREKQGWTCDTYIVSRAAMYNFNMTLFFEKWVRDLALSETPQGGYTTVAPATGYDGNSSTTWPAALIYVPYDALNFYGDTRILSDNLRNMKTFAASSMAREIPGKPDIINDVLGDWVSPHPTIDDTKPRHNDMAPPEGLPFYGTTSHYRVHKLISRIGAALGDKETEVSYARRAEEIAGHFNDEFFDPETHTYHGTIPTGYRQSTNATALWYGLVPDNEYETVENGLVEQIRANGDHLGTGFLGIQSLMGILPDKDPELTFRMITQPTYPSWGYMVARGATGMWETWDGYDSQNHLPFSMVSEYFYRHLAGIRFDETAPGFRNILIQPAFISSLDHVRCHYDSINGRIESNWTKKDGKVTLEVTIPGNTTADVVLPEGATDVKESGTVPAEGKDGILSVEDGRIRIGSGHYTFTFGI